MYTDLNLSILVQWCLQGDFRSLRGGGGGSWCASPTRQTSKKSNAYMWTTLMTTVTTTTDTQFLHLVDCVENLNPAAVQLIKMEHLDSLVLYFTESLQDEAWERQIAWGRVWWMTASSCCDEFCFDSRWSVRTTVLLPTSFCCRVVVHILDHRLHKGFYKVCRCALFCPSIE